MVNFKPKTEYFDQFVAYLKETVIYRYVLIHDNEIMEIWLEDSIDGLAEQQPSALSWLDRHWIILRENSEKERHTRTFTAFVKKELAYLRKRD